MIYLIGYMGSGKTVTSKSLALKLKMPFYDTDDEIEKREKRSVSKIFNIDGEAYFRKLETEILVNICQESIISCGGGLPVNNNNMELINSKGTSIYLKASNNCLFNRLKNVKKNRPLITNKTNKELNTYIKKGIKSREPFYELAHYTVLVDNKSIQEILREINSLVGSH